MPQAALPDLNTAFIVYRREAITSLKSRRYDACFGSLYAINALLPDEYRVSISTAQYEKKVKLDMKVVCKECNAMINYENIKIYDILLPFTINIITSTEYERVWDCPDCLKTNRLLQTKIQKQTMKEPTFLKIVPNPPIRKQGLMDRTNYHKQISIWVWTLLDELESQMSNYRREYQPRSDEFLDQENSLEETGEEQ